MSEIDKSLKSLKALVEAEVEAEVPAHA